MASRIKNQVLIVTLLSVFISSLFPFTQASADEASNSIPTISSFIESVKDGNPASLRGIYVRGVMAHPIIQQPYGNPGFVSSVNDTVTQFSIASEVGNIGLLAHNYLAGVDFSALKTGDIITLVYGDGHTQSFLVEEILQYQATSPLSPYSNFIDLNTQELLTAEQLFNKVYRGDFHVTLQTCIEKDGELSWGRLFIIAKPMSEKYLDLVPQTVTIW
ncbi:MAG: hypothetical protein HC797_02740 [Anaerolineales bacterium]|nr:hypothetical protein [Anaerolineales bacterium]